MCFKNLKNQHIVHLKHNILNQLYFNKNRYFSILSFQSDRDIYFGKVTDAAVQQLMGSNLGMLSWRHLCISKWQNVQSTAGSVDFSSWEHVQ